MMKGQQEEHEDQPCSTASDSAETVRYGQVVLKPSTSLASVGAEAPSV